ncbi:MAG: HAD family phosphatase [Ruminococcaceae bacterium]|nr:HAD family phosphatase [Oscillospiraceae bacterium]
MRKFDAVLFDMDGVLIDSESLYSKADEEMFRFLEIDVTMEERVALVGVNLKSGSKLLLEYHPEIKYTYDELMEIYENSLLAALQNADELALIPGVEQWLKSLHEAGVKLAVASSSTKKMVDYIVERFGLLRYVDFVINGDMVTKSKPDPEIFLRAAEGVGVAPERCAVVEDSKPGICAAKDAGMYCVAFSGANVFGADQSQADVCVDEYTEETLCHLLG